MCCGSAGRNGRARRPLPACSRRATRSWSIAYDYHDARSHSARAAGDPDRFPTFNGFLSALDGDPDSVWSRPSPAEMFQRALAVFAERFEMVLEDLAALPEEAPVLAVRWNHERRTLKVDVWSSLPTSGARLCILSASCCFRLVGSVSRESTCWSVSTRTRSHRSSSR